MEGQTISKMILAAMLICTVANFDGRRGINDLS